MGMIESIVLGEASIDLGKLAKNLEAAVRPLSVHARGVGSASQDPELAAALNRFAAAISTMAHEISVHTQAASTMAENVSKDIIAATGGTSPPPKNPGGLPLIIGAGTTP